VASAILALGNSTISQNTADLGGGVFVSVGSASLNNSIIAGNSQFPAPDVSGPLGAIITPKYCLIGSNSGSGFTEAPLGSPDANGNLIGGPLHGYIDPKLGSLANNGGYTLTCAPLVGSPAISGGDPAAIAGQNNTPQYDQRGISFTRVVGGRIDIGALEFRPALPGDYSFNGTVDAADYSVWRDTLGSTTDLHADASGPTVGTPNGIIDQADYDFWKFHFGNVSAGSGAGAASLVTSAIDSASQPPPLRGGFSPAQPYRWRRRRIPPQSIRNPKSAIHRPRFSLLAPQSTHDSALLTWFTAWSKPNERTDEAPAALSMHPTNDYVESPDDLNVLDSAFRNTCHFVIVGVRAILLRVAALPA
jgi:hypothetical protein